MVGQLDGKSAIITGASRGVGLAIARRFFDAGANVVLADADEETIQKEALALDENKERAISFRCDPTKRLDLNNLMAAAVDAFDDVDILVHTASVVAAGENEQKRANCAIVNVSALSSYSVIPNRFALGISMAALDQLTRGFAVAFAEDGIRVNGIAPGGISGRFSGLSDPDARKAVVKRTPMQRLGDPSEIADAAVFLASDQASFITGQVIVADGGRSIYDMPMPEPEG